MNYKQTNIVASEHQRAFDIHIFNPFAAVPSVIFEEEQIFVKDDGKVIHDQTFSGGSTNMVGHRLAKQIANFDELQQMWNPLTGEKIPGVFFPISQAYALIHSVYMNEALIRDGKIAYEGVMIPYRAEAAADLAAANAATAVVDTDLATAEVAALATANALADSKATPAEKLAVMQQYNLDRLTRAAAAVTQKAAIMADYEAARVAKLALAEAAAQAAYDAIVG